jgi:hypothetical protein
MSTTNKTSGLRTAWGILSIQLALICIIAFVPFGFDHPRGFLRLDFGDLLIVLILYGGMLLVGLVWAATRKQWKLLVLQLVALVAGYFIAVAAGVN